MPSRSLLAVLAVAAAAVITGCAAIEQPTPTPTPTQPSPTAPAEPSPTGAAEPTPIGPGEPTPTPTGPVEPTPAPTAAGEPPAIAFAQVAGGLDALTLLTHAGDGSGRLYVVEQRGIIRLLELDGTLHERPFLDISERVRSGGERGLLGLAFHPQYATNGRFFINYTAVDGSNVIAEMSRLDDSAGDPSSERVLLTIEQPFSNHNGGMLAFGPDGRLYISSGDGGSGGDPHGHGQRLDTLLGAVLRIDVDGEQPYAIPPDNPFVGRDGARPEIWSYGLRNPWRLSFDRLTGDMLVADVGQDRWEEVNIEPAGAGGRNYGWNVMEGPDCFGAGECSREGLTLPVAWYETASGCAITGGYVYRAAALPALDGFYLFADYCSGLVWALDAGLALDALAASQLPLAVHEMGSAGINVTGFGEDEAGELYLVGAGGEVLRVVAAD